MKHFTIKRGERPPATPRTTGPVEDAEPVSSVAILGADWPGLRPHLEVAPGARVSKGQTVFTDRTHRKVCFVAPASGVVEAVTFARRRQLDALVIRLDEDVTHGKPPELAKRKSPREKLLAYGFWPAFRTRPFGTIPAPDAMPDCIVVNAVQPAPQAPDPALLIRERLEAFRLGCSVLTNLTAGPVHICQSPGLPLGPDEDRIRHTSFSGTIAAGLAGTQIDRLCPNSSVWSIGYQDVIAIGHFFATGDFDGQRILSVTGETTAPGRLLRAPIGARIADLVGASGAQGIAGGPGLGREAAFLGRFHSQITLIPAGANIPGSLTGSRQADAAIPTRALERAIAVDVLAVPLLRALSLGDAETSERLGCLALLEEDLAAATRVCTSGVDYGACLRSVLNDLMAEAA